MKILVAADIHGSEAAIPALNKKIAEHKPDIVVVAGDITNFGPPEWARNFLTRIPVKIIAVPGNCDPPGVITEIEKSAAVSLHKKKFRIGSYFFVGFGGSNITPFNTVLEFSEDYIYEALAKLMENNCILITHCPAKGTLDFMAEKGNLGSEAIAKIVKKYKPVLHISAHIHEARGIKYGETVFVNPGPASKNRFALVQINKKIKAELI